VTEPRPLAPDAIKAMAAMYVANSPTIPDEHTGALVAIVNIDHIEIAVATRMGQSWTVNLAARYAWSGERKLEATIKKTW